VSAVVLFSNYGTFNSALARDDRQTDSLSRLLANTKQDSDRVNIMTRISYRLLDAGDHQSAMKYARQALAITRSINYPTGEYWSYLHIGNVYFFLGNTDSTLENYNLAVLAARQSGKAKFIAGGIHNLGNVYYNQGKPIEALKRYSEALKILEEVGDTYGMAEEYVSIAGVYGDEGRSEEAMEKYLSALKTFEAAGSKKEVSTCYYHIGQLFSNQNNFPEAQKYFQLSLAMDEEQGNKNGMATCHNIIGSVYEKQHNYEQALKHHFESLRIKKEIGDTPGTVISGYNIGLAYLSQNRYTEALKWFLEVLKSSKEMENRLGVAYASAGLAETYLHQGKLTQAADYSGQALPVIEEFGILTGMSQLHKLIAQIDSARGDYKSSYKHLKEHIKLEDSVVNDEKERRITRLAMQYEFSRNQDSLKYIHALKLKQQELLTTKQRTAKNYLIGSLILLGGLSLFAYNNYRTKQQLKLQKLRNRIASDLHDDVGSTLSSISIFSQMAQEQSKDVIPALNTIGESSRKMLDAMADIVWTINPENDQFEKIIMRMRSFAYELLGAKKVEFRFVADDDVSKINLSMEARKNVYLIFKEATNNLVKYAEASRAIFTLKRESDQLTMTIRDDGKGFNTASEAGGNGLKNMKKRALEIGADLFIDSFPGNGTTIRLQLTV
jgi:signal transduction histidine kinase